MKIEIKKPGILYLSQAQYEIRIAVKMCARPATQISRRAGVSYSTMQYVTRGIHEPSKSIAAAILGAVDQLNEMDRLNKERNSHNSGLSLSSYLTQQAGV